MAHTKKLNSRNITISEYLRSDFDSDMDTHTSVKSHEFSSGDANDDIDSRELMMYLLDGFDWEDN